MAEGGNDILLTFLAETRQAIQQVRAFFAENLAGLRSLGDAHPEIRVNIESAAESLQQLEADILEWRRQVHTPEEIRINSQVAQQRLSAILLLLRGIEEDLGRLPEVAQDAAAGVAVAADRIAAAERLAAAEAERVRAALAGTVPAAERAGEAATRSQGPAAEAYRAANAALAELNRQLLESGGRATPELAAAVRRAEAALEAFAQAVRAASGGDAAFGADLARLQRNLLEAAGAARALGVDLDRVPEAANRAAEGARNLGQASERASSGGLSFLSRAVNRIAFSLEYFIARDVIRRVFEFGEAAAEAAQKADRLRIGLESATGGMRQGAEAEEFLRAEARRLGFDVNALAESFVKFTATATAAKVPVADQHALFSRLMETIVSLRQPVGEGAKALQLLSDVLDRGAVSTVELRRRLSDELPAAMAALRAATGLTEDELSKMTKGGQLGAQVMLPLVTRLAEEVGGGYQGALASAGAEQERLRSELERFGVEIGQHFLPALAGATSDLRLWVEENRDGAVAIGTFLSGIIKLAELIQKTDQAFMASAEVTGEYIRQSAALTDDLAGAQRRLAEATTTSEERAAEHAASLHLEAMASREAMRILEERVAAIQREGGVTASTARLIVSEIDAQILKAREYSEADRAYLADRLANLQVARDALARFTVDLTEQLSQQIAATRRYARDFEDELKRTGTVSHEAADRIVKEVKDEIKAVQQLPVAERAAFQERLLALNQLGAEFEKFTTAYEKESERQAKAAERAAEAEAKRIQERTKAWVTFAEEVERIAGRLEKAEGAPDDSKRKDLAKAQAELAGLQAKPTSSLEEENRMQALRRQIDQTQDALRREAEVHGRTAQEEAQAVSKVSQQYVDLKQKIADVFETNGRLRDDIAALGPESRGVFDQLTEGLLSSARAGKLSSDQVKQYFDGVGALLTAAGRDATDLTARLQAVTDPARRISQDLDAIPPAAQQGTAAVGQLASGAQQAAAAAGTVKSAFDQAGAAAGTAGQRFHSSAEAVQAGQRAEISFSEAGREVVHTLIDQAGAVHQTVQGMAAGEHDYIAFRGVVRDLGESVRSTTTDLQVQRKTMEDGSTRLVVAGTETKDLARDQGELKQRTDDLVPQVKAHGDATQQLATSTDRAAASTGKLATASEQAATTLRQAAESTSTLADDLHTAAPDLDALAQSAAQLVGDALSEELRAEADAAAPLARDLPLVATAAGRLADGASRAHDGVAKLNRDLASLKTALADVLPLLQQFIRLEADAAKACADLTTCLVEQAAA